MRKLQLLRVVNFFTFMIFLGAVPVYGNQIIVDPKADIFNAGRTAPVVDGLLPSEILLSSSGKNRYVTFPSVEGTLNAGSGWPWVGPDGGEQAFGFTPGTNIFSAVGVSGIVADRFQFLVGVYLGDTPLQEGAEPPRLDFTSIGYDFKNLYPLIGQMFFIGDGHVGTGGGALQRFYAPESATHLYLGFADANTFGWPNGAYMSSYVDNTGWLTATYSLHSGGNNPVPEPTTFLLFSSGIACLVRVRKK